MDKHNPFSQLSAIIIDDDHGTAWIFKTHLELCGINVVGIGYDGKAAVELYQKFKPDIVILDVMMPNFDGFYGLEKIKQLDSNAKVIMATADTTLQTLERLKSLSANSIIYKPFEIDEIFLAITRVTQLECVYN
ncbi:MAG: response regulator [Candidatus Nitrosotenuis sp.]